MTQIKKKKETFKKDLFAGLGTGGDKKTTPQDIFKNNSNVITKKEEKPANNSNKGKNVDLLELGIGSNTNTNTTSNQNQSSSNVQTNKPSNVNLVDLESIFSSTQTTQPQTQNNNILNFSQPTDTKPKQNEFNFLNNKKGLSKNDVTPLKIDTETFGGYWGDCPNDETTYEINSSSINTPEKYCKVIGEGGNFHPVEIIGEEAIAAGKVKNSIVLLHTTINSNGKLENKIQII